MTQVLPIGAIIPDVLNTLESARNLVVEAPPGAGKSTVLPLALLETPWARNRRILLLEPRRLAARAVAARMANTLGQRVGETVGYRMRLDTRVSARTRLEVVTEGVLTRMLQEDPALEGVAAVIFDEFHERSLAADLGLALALEAQATVAPQLRLLVMSATLDGAGVATLLGDAPVIRAEGRQYPVAIHYAGQGLPQAGSASDPLAWRMDALAATLMRLLDESTGDVLVFLPGSPEIRRVSAALAQATGKNQIQLHELYGDLPFEAQEIALRPTSRGMRKIVLATNVAETSLTIDGVRVVVDSGLVRRSRFDPSTGMSRLVTERVSRASADQRAGRAGRTASGVCYRLWSEGSHSTLAAFTPPEIMVADLAPLALELAAWGTANVTHLSWLDTPPTAHLTQARELLQGLQALDAGYRITTHGRAMAALGLHPRLAHMLLRARETGQGALAVQLAALLSERDLLRSQRDPDLRSRLEVLQRSDARVDAAALARVRRTINALAAEGEITAAIDDRRAGEVLALAYPDRIAQRRNTGEAGHGARYRLANGRGARLERASTLSSAEYLVAADLDDAEGAEAVIRLAAPLDRPALEQALAPLIRSHQETGYDGSTQGAYARRSRRLGELVLEEQLQTLGPEEASAILLSVVTREGLSALPWGPQSRSALARLRFAQGRKASSAGEWPEFDDQSLRDSLADWLGPFMDSITRLGQIDDALLTRALQGRLNHAQRRQLDELAPTHITVPTGTRVAVDYEDASAPCIEVRLQEVFGLASTPQIGRIPVTLKLLSPARRPVQITRDLQGFWRGSYAEVRKDMRGRYPKHYWPEDPLQAEPRRGTSRPRR